MVVNNPLYHLESRWRNSHVLVYHSPLPIRHPTWDWLICAIYFHYGVIRAGSPHFLLGKSQLSHSQWIGLIDHLKPGSGVSASKKKIPQKIEKMKTPKDHVYKYLTYDVWVTKTQNKELLMCLCVCMWFSWCLPWSVGQQRFVFCVQNVILLIVCKVLVFWRVNWFT